MSTTKKTNAVKAQGAKSATTLVKTEVKQPQIFKKPSPEGRSLEEIFQSLGKINKAKKFYFEVNQRLQLLNDLTFSDEPVKQMLQITDANGETFVTTSKMILEKVTSLLMEEGSIRKIEAEQFLKSASL